MTSGERGAGDQSKAPGPEEVNHRLSVPQARLAHWSNHWKVAEIKAALDVIYEQEDRLRERAHELETQRYHAEQDLAASDRELAQAARMLYDEEKEEAQTS